MSIENGAGPTAAERIRALTTELVELPRLSEKAGEPIRVCIRILDALSEYLPAIQDIPTMRMEPKERVAYMQALDEAGQREIARRHFEADKVIIALGVLSPRVVQEDQGEPGTIPVHALLHDRVFLVERILALSQLLGTPSGKKKETATDSPQAAGVAGEAFRLPVESPAGDGGAVEAAPVRDPGAPAG